MPLLTRISRDDDDDDDPHKSQSSVTSDKEHSRTMTFPSTTFPSTSHASTTIGNSDISNSLLPSLNSASTSDDPSQCVEVSNAASTTCSTDNGNSLSAGARSGISFGILVGSIIAAILTCWYRRRARRARNRPEKMVPSEIRQYLPQVSTSDRDVAPHVNADEAQLLPSEYHESPVITNSPPPPSVDNLPLCGSPTIQRRSCDLVLPSHRTSTAFSDVHLPNPYDSALYQGISPLELAVSNRRLSSTPPSTVRSKSALLAERGASTLHADLLIHQKGLELEHRKDHLEALTVPEDPPPGYNS
ncbi:hypothetical protein V8B97DRAFT_1276252 [Scleroderma yunnanense]